MSNSRERRLFAAYISLKDNPAACQILSKRLDKIRKRWAPKPAPEQGPVYQPTYFRHTGLQNLGKPVLTVELGPDIRSATSGPERLWPKTLRSSVQELAQACVGNRAAGLVVDLAGNLPPAGLFQKLTAWHRAFGIELSFWDSQRNEAAEPVLNHFSHPLAPSLDEALAAHRWEDACPYFCLPSQNHLRIFSSVRHGDLLFAELPAFTEEAPGGRRLMLSTLLSRHLTPRLTKRLTFVIHVDSHTVDLGAYRAAARHIERMGGQAVVFCAERRSAASFKRFDRFHTASNYPEALSLARKLSGAPRLEVPGGGWHIFSPPRWNPSLKIFESEWTDRAQPSPITWREHLASFTAHPFPCRLLLNLEDERSSPYLENALQDLSRAVLEKGGTLGVISENPLVRSKLLAVPQDIIVFSEIEEARLRLSRFASVPAPPGGWSLFTAPRRLLGSASYVRLDFSNRWKRFHGATGDEQNTLPGELDALLASNIRGLAVAATPPSSSHLDCILDRMAQALKRSKKRGALIVSDERLRSTLRRRHPWFKTVSSPIEALVALEGKISHPDWESLEISRHSLDSFNGAAMQCCCLVARFRNRARAEKFFDGSSDLQVIDEILTLRLPHAAIALELPDFAAQRFSPRAGALLSNLSRPVEQSGHGFFLVAASAAARAKIRGAARGLSVHKNWQEGLLQISKLLPPPLRGWEMFSLHPADWRTVVISADRQHEEAFFQRGESWGRVHSEISAILQHGIDAFWPVTEAGPAIHRHALDTFAHLSRSHSRRGRFALIASHPLPPVLHRRVTVYPSLQAALTAFSADST